MPEKVYLRTLQRAADIVGGVEKLRQLLVPSMQPRLFQRWMDGSVEPTREAFLDAVDIVVKQKLTETSNAARANRASQQSDKKE